MDRPGTALVAAPLAFMIAVAPAAAGFLDAIGLGDDEEEKSGSYIERFEPASGGYAAIVADRSTALALKRSENYGLVPSAALNGYLNRIIARLRPVLPVPDVPVKGYVTASSEPMAQATPDGGIFVSVALLRTFGTEDAIAFAVAHEIAHVLYRDHDTDWFVNSQKFAAQAVTLGAQMKSVDKGTAFENSGLLVAMDVATSFSERVVAPNLWNKEQEDTADRLAADIIVKAEYNIDAAFDVLAIMAQLDASRRERIAAQRKAQSAAFGEQLVKGLQSGDKDSAFSSALSGFKNFGKTLVDDAMDAVGGGNYYSPEERVERLREYVKKNHRYAPRNNLIALPWEKGEKTLAAVMGNYTIADDAKVAINEGRFDEAVVMARTALRPPTETDALPAISLATALGAKGDRVGMYKALLRATRSREPSFAIYSAMISEQLAKHDYDEALSLSAKAMKRLEDPPYLWPVQISLLAATNRKLEAYAAMARCRLEMPDLADACDKALEGLREPPTRLGDDAAARAAAAKSSKSEPTKSRQMVAPVSGLFRSSGEDK